MKKIISLIAVALICVSMLVIGSPVAGAVVNSIPEVNIKAALNKDGTASITEEWNIVYSGLPEPFLRSIDVYSSGKGSSKATEAQKFKEIKNVNVKAYVDGKEVEVTAPTCGMSKAGDSYDINIERAITASSTVKYVITYTVTDAVKSVGKDAMFSMVVIGGTFFANCNNVTYEVVFPEPVGADNIMTDEESEMFVGKTDSSVTYNASIVSDVFAVEVRVPRNAFINDALPSYSPTAAAFRVFMGKVSKVLPVIIGVAVALAIAVFILFGDKIVRSKYKKQADAELKDMDDLPGSLIGNMTACEQYKMLVPYSKLNPKSTSKRVPFLFGMAVLECIESGYIVKRGNGFAVGIPNAKIPSYQLSVLNFLRSLAVSENGVMMLDNRFAERVTAECIASYDNIANYLSSFYDLIPSVNGRFFRKDENLNAYKTAYAVRHKIISGKYEKNFCKYAEAVMQTVKTTDAEVFAMLFATAKAKFFEPDNNSDVAIFGKAIYEMYKVYTKAK